MWTNRLRWRPPSCFDGRYVSKALAQQAIDPARRLLRRTLRHERASEAGLSRTQSCFGERKVDEIALGQAPAAAMCDVAHAQ
jgi:hypothetical protein